MIHKMKLTNEFMDMTALSNFGIQYSLKHTSQSNVATQISGALFVVAIVVVLVFVLFNFDFNYRKSASKNHVKEMKRNNGFYSCKNVL